MRPIIARMEQAATDVLFNKKDWRDASTERRAVWTPKTGTTDDEGGVFVTQGADVTLQAQLLDEYGAFPLDLGGIISPPPANWWPRPPGSLQMKEAPVQIVADDATA